MALLLGAVLIQVCAPGSFAQTPPASASITPLPGASPTILDERYFPQTGYRIDHDAFWAYFQHRGAVGSFGYPVSNTFTLAGHVIQIFQRRVLQLNADGSVGLLNLLDPGLMPYTAFNGSNVPGPDSSVMSQAPPATQLPQVLDYVRAKAPDTFDGQPVSFGRTFFGSVQATDAFADGDADPDAVLLPGFDLELWGLPTSQPTYDPANHNFIYMRFQRGIMHYDKTCGCTQGLLLGDYFKKLLRNDGLPGDLAREAAGSPYLGEFAPALPHFLARPTALDGTDLTNAFWEPVPPTAPIMASKPSPPQPSQASTKRAPIVTIDPGHGGTEIGTSHTFPDGTVLAEKDLTLRVANILHGLLQNAGDSVTQTRTTDSHVNADGKDLRGDGGGTLSDDLQARVDIANQNHSDIFVSVHFNGVSDPSVKGTYIFYDPSRPTSDRSQTLAQLMDSSIIKSLADAGYSSDNHGATPDTQVLAGSHYYLLGPQSDIVTRPSLMPAVICEGLFLTNVQDATALLNDRVVQAVAQGYANGIQAYFIRYPPT